MNHRGRALALFSFTWLAIGLCAPSADAHLMPARQGTLNVVDDSVFAVLSVPVSSLHDFDDDGDGLLGLRELERHKIALREEIDRRFALSDGGSVARTVQLDLVLSPQHDMSPDRASELVALKHARFPSAPTDLVLACDLFGSRDAERQITITATHRVGAERATEALVFTPRATEHHFFRPLTAAFAGYVRVGIEHILFGADHLLFLLTVVVAGIGWRYWLRVVTSFTAAHSLTLGAAMLGYVRVPSRVVEPLIALSIVLMALDNLVRKGRAPRQRVAPVAACGLLHGLGFASSMDAMGLDGAHRLTSLLGFNVGVELGQTIFLVAVLASFAALRQLFPRQDDGLRVRALSGFAFVTGSLWVIERVVGS